MDGQHLTGRITPKK